MSEQKKTANEQEDNKKKDNSGNAANIDAIISSPTENVRSRRGDATWSDMGTNISYEGQTAPGGAGSVGTGQSSGQDATGETISGSSEYEHGGAERPDKESDTGTEDNKTKDTI